jgi:hypothetical protein
MGSITADQAHLLAAAERDSRSPTDDDLTSGQTFVSPPSHKLLTLQQTE